jgi:hypothetical protein
MRPQDIEKIANSVVGAFGRPVRASAGCAGVSDPQTFSCSQTYDCSGGYACGGQGVFTCVAVGFQCDGNFVCESNWDCMGTYQLI